MSETPSRPIGPGTLLTFDCYGTLIDWESGILAAIRAAYPKTATVADHALLDQFHEVQNELKTSEYRSYRDLLTEVAAQIARIHGREEDRERDQDRDREGDRDRTAIIPASIPSWLPFPDTNAALSRLDAAGVALGILSNIDNDLLAETLKHLDTSFSLLGTAQSLRSYKPAAPHFELGREWAGEYDTWLHVAQSLFHDVVPATAQNIPVIWVNRKSQSLPDDARPIHTAPDLTSTVAWLLGD